MFRTIAVGCSKMDSKVLAPPIAEIEELAAWAFRKADRDNDGEISRAEFDVFVFTSPTVAHFLSFLAGAMNEEVLAPGVKFTDPGRDERGHALHRLGGPPSGGVPAEEARGQARGLHAGHAQALRPQGCRHRHPGADVGRVPQRPRRFVQAGALRGLFVPTARRSRAGSACASSPRHGPRVALREPPPPSLPRPLILDRARSRAGQGDAHRHRRRHPLQRAEAAALRELVGPVRDLADAHREGVRQALRLFRGAQLGLDEAALSDLLGGTSRRPSSTPKR